MRNNFNPWHQVVPHTESDDVVKGIIEISKGTKAKYELDKESGLLRLDRVLFSSIYYPHNYGFIPQTYCDDHDPLDILILSQIEVVPLCIVEAKIIGVMRMLDNGEADDKIIAVAFGDPSVNHYNDISELPQYLISETMSFFEDYTKLENKTVVVDKFFDKETALQIIDESYKLYQKNYGELHKWFFGWKSNQHDIFNAVSAMDKYSEIAKAMGEEIDGLTKEVAAQAAVDAEKALAVKVGIPERLRDLNVKEKDLEKLAVSAFNDVCTPGNPREVLMVEILELYKKAFWLIIGFVNSSFYFYPQPSLCVSLATKFVLQPNKPSKKIFLFIDSNVSRKISLAEKAGKLKKIAPRIYTSQKRKSIVWKIT